MKKTVSIRLSNIILSIIFLIAVFAILSGCHSKAKSVSIKTVEQGFVTPPDSVRIACYWYWLNDNLSPEGAVKDLHAMKKAGITRAQIGMIGVDGVPDGNACYNSDLWWETLHQALKTASELDIEIGIFNCPGWSQSGGPWIAPEQSMRHIVSAEIDVEGAGLKSIILPEVEGACQDEAVIAYPAVATDAFSRKWTFDKAEGTPLNATLNLDSPKTVRSLTVTVNSPINTAATLKVLDGDDWHVVKRFNIDRYNAQNIVGFEPYAPIRIAIPECVTSNMALQLGAEGSGEIEVELSEAPVVERNAEKSLAKMCQVPLPMWDFYMWDTDPSYSSDADRFVIDPAKVVVLTDKVKDGVLEWEVPEGRWTVSRIAMATTGVTNSPATPAATGLEVDKMNKEHLQHHFDSYIGEIMRRIPAEDRRTFKILVEDSYETGGQNWTDSLTEKFTRRYGYSPLPYLPVLKGIPVGSNDESSRFLWDLRRLVADLVAYEYVGGLKEISNANGLTTWLENYGHWGFPAEFLQYGGQSDEIAGEFWSEGDLGDIENRAASSCGHIYGKKRVWAESCTAAGNPFGRYPNMMKQRVDKFFTEGINATLLHLYIHQPDTDVEPGLAAWFGNEFNRKNVWFDHLDLFTDYLRRCNYVLQQGQYQAEAAYFIGEDAPKMTGVCNPELPQGYSFDYINAEILKDHAHVKNGRLCLDSGMEYDVLVLPVQETMRPEMLACIESMVDKGLTVVGTAPLRSPSLQGYPECDSQLRNIASRLWTAGKKSVECGKGKVWAEDATLDEVFADKGINPDLAVAEGEPMPLFIHRSLPDAEIYFVANPLNETIDINPTFRAGTGLNAEWWDATNGSIRVLPQVTDTETGALVPMELKPLESAFIVFRSDIEPAAAGLNSPAPVEIADITDNGWLVNFQPERRGPEDTVTSVSLFNWADSSDKNIANYSGKATYRTGFDVNDIPTGRVFLDLGKVAVMAKVKVNGKSAGGVWTDPYRVDVTDFLVKGNNVVEIEVVNTWHNRLIGDAALSEAERLTWTNLPGWNPDEPLHPAGLLGPVKIVAYDYTTK